MNNNQIFKDYENIFIIDLEGNVIPMDNNSANVNFIKYLEETIASNAITSQPKILKFNDKPIILIFTPILDENQVIKGFISASIKLSDIADIIDTTEFGELGYAFMVDSTGLIIAHPNYDIVFKDNYLAGQYPSLLNVINKMKNTEDGTEYYMLKDEKKLISYKPLKSIPCTIGVSIVYKDMIRSLSVLKWVCFLTITILTLITSLLLILSLNNSIINPLNKLKHLIELAIAGDLSVKSDINTDDEIGILSNSFNTLIRENKRLLEEAIENDKVKTNFFSNVSHELKTPLNLIFSTTQLMSLNNKKGNLDILKLNTHIRIINQNCYRLLRLVNNLIDITKIDSGFITPKLQNINIVEVVENITQSTVEYVKSYSKEIVFDTEIEEKIMAFDPDKMERILLNLISNAVKFTEPNDKIEVNIYDKKESVIISVKDTGIGIPKEKQKIIFERFVQVDSLFTRKKEGSGIGLTLVKSLVEMHNGTISLKSDLNKGTEFLIEIPIKLVESEYDYTSSQENAYQVNVEKINIEFSERM